MKEANTIKDETKALPSEKPTITKQEQDLGLGVRIA
jgi:hypothetical protein